MDCRTVQAVKFKRKLGFKQYDVIMTQEQYVLTKLDRQNISILCFRV